MARVLDYDTLVLEKDTDYDTKGNLTPNASDGRAKAWTGRAQRAGATATDRRNRARDEIANREKLANELQRRNEREEQARLDELEAAAAVAPDRANDGGVDPPSVAAMQYEEEQEPVRDPHGGRASLVRSMVERIRNLSRNQGGLEIPESQQEVRGLADLGSGKNQGRKRSASLWRPLGETFRKREAALSQKIGSAAALIRAQNPEDLENPNDPAKYEVSQKLFNYLFGAEVPSDPELRGEITELCKESPTVPASTFEGLRDFDSGSKWNERSASTNTRTAAESSEGRQFPPVAPEENAWKK
jgi:hypothetical protein